jgi:hypothetical protein
MATGAAGAAAAAANAIRASGVVVRVKPEEFAKLLARARDPLVVRAKGGFFGKKHDYLMSYKGLAFYCTADEPLPLPAGVELVVAGSIYMPG